MLRSEIRRELGPMFRLALPVVIGELGWVALTVVDTAMVGRLGPEAIGAVSLGRAVVMFVGVFGLGVLLGLDTLVSQAYGAGRPRECHRWLVQGLHLAWMLGIPSTALLLGLFVPVMGWVDIDPTVRGEAQAYLGWVSWSALPLLIYTALRRYLQALGRPGTVMRALVSANLVNALANWLLIYGHWNFPRLEAAGAGVATVASMTYLAAYMGLAVWREARKKPDTWRGVSWRLEIARLRRLFRLGLPVGLQISLELGVFALATWMAGFLAPVALAAHQIVITLASMTFMVPLGISAAGSVRVGHAIGRGDPEGAGWAGWTALLLGGGFMSIAAAAFIALPNLWMGLFTDAAPVVAIGRQLLIVAGLFQISDGLQAVATGNLRGAGDTRTALVWNGLSHWLIGLPLSAWLAFGTDAGVVGIWIGLSVSLTLVAIGLVREWTRRVVRMRANPMLARRG